MVNDIQIYTDQFSCMFYVLQLIKITWHTIWGSSSSFYTYIGVG